MSPQLPFKRDTLAMKDPFHSGKRRSNLVDAARPTPDSPRGLAADYKQVSRLGLHLPEMPRDLG